MEMQSTYQPNTSQSYQKMSDNDSQTWHIISIISWIFFIISIWISYHSLIYVWAPYQALNDIYLNRYGYFPLEIGLRFPYLCIYLFLISIIGFSIYLYFTTYKKKQALYDGMLGNLSKFHFIPLLFIAGLYILSISGSNISGERDERFKSYRTLISFNLIFTILGLICLIIVYLRTELNCDWYIILTIKKGVYSSFIIILLYNFFHMIVSFKYINYNLDVNYENYEDFERILEDFRKFFKGSGIAFIILFGLISLIFSFVFKDLMAAFTTFLIYLGMVVAFFNKNESQIERRKEYYNGYSDGVLDIIFMLLSLAVIVILIFKFRQNLF